MPLCEWDSPVVVAPTSCGAPITGVTFSDSFPGTTLDAAKWSTTGQGTAGTITVTPGKAQFDVSGDVLFAQSISNPIPVTGDFSVYCKGNIYNSGNSHASMCSVHANTWPAVANLGGDTYWQTWASHGDHGDVMVVSTGAPGSILFSDHHPEDLNSVHEYELCVRGDKVERFKDGVSQGSAFLPPDWIRPAFVAMGNPGSSGPSWSNFETIAIQIRTLATSAINATAVTPTSARLDIPQNFTITGTGLTTNMGFTIEDCDGTQEVGTGTLYQRTYQCTPRLPGPKQLTFKTAPGDTTPLFTTTINIDHPARLGNAGARGIPSVNGVSLWNGNVHLEATDLAVPGRGVSFALTRSYNSYSWAYEDSRGSVSNSAPWRFNWDIKLGYLGAGTAQVNTNQIWVEREDGSGENFFKDATDGLWYPMDQGNFNRIRGDYNGFNVEAGKTTLMTREGLQYVFYNPDYSVDPGKKGLLIGIYDHDGNGLTVHRDASNRVGTVSDASNRVYTFGYDGNNRLTSVRDFTTNPIRQVAYTWDGTSNRLATVTDVRGGVTTYNYTLKTSALALNKPADQTLLTSIIDPVGYLAAPRYNARTFTYTDKVYGNWGVDSAKDALNNTWNFVYCAKLASSSNCSNGSTQVDPVTALSFETTTTPPQGAVTVARFDTGGRLVEQVNANAKTSKTTPLPMADLTSKTYNLAALAKKRQSALGATGSFGTDYAYTPDNAGNLLTKATSISATETATTASTWTPANAATLLTKNLHRANTVTDAKGAPTALTHTNSGSLATHQPPGLAATVLGYDPAAFGQLTSVTDARSNTTTRTYDTDGNLVKLIDPPGTAAALYVQYTPDALGRVVISRDKRGFITNNTWDEAGNLKSTYSTVNGQLILVEYDYDANGNRSKMTDANRNVTNYTYDRNNRLKTVEKVRPGLSTLITTTNYDPLGRVTSTVNANSHANTTVLDDVGNTTSSYSALGLSYATLYQYDDDNRVTQVTDPDGRVTKTTYDRVGHVKTVTTGFTSINPLTTQYDYDLNGRMVKMTDPRNNITQYDYDPSGRLITLTDANLKITRATYDGNGNLLTVQDPLYTVALDPKHKTVYTYDELNRPLTRVDGNGQVWTNTYNDLANTKTLTVPGPKTTTFSFDAVDRLIRVDYPDATWVTYTYYADGSRKTMVDSTGTTQYFYDAVNRLTSKIDPAGKMVGYDYDGIGNVTTLTYPGAKPVGYHYDPGERLDQVTDWLGKTTVYTLNKAGQVTHALFGNGTTVDRVFDASGRQTSLINKKADGTSISSHGLTLDGNGNITASTTTLPLQPSLPNVNRVFTPDGANRIATMTVNNVATTVGYDVAGRMTALAGNTYTYNDRDQITAVAGTQPATYAYNGQGHRVTRTIGGTTTRFVIDPNRSLPEVLAETDSAGTVLRNYVYGYGLVEQIDAAGTAKYYHFDPTGSTLALTNAAGVVTDSYAYTPYGETTTSGSTVNPFKYVGKLGVMDDSNGLHFMRARYYRADIGRFMSLDKLTGTMDKPQTLNRYTYATGNPVMGVDPSGLWSCEFCDSVTKWEESFVKSFGNPITGALSDTIINPGLDLGSALGNFVYDLTPSNWDEISMNTLWSAKDIAIAPLNMIPFGLAVNTGKGVLKGAIAPFINFFASNSTTQSVKNVSFAAIDFGAMFINPKSGVSPARAMYYLNISKSISKQIHWTGLAYDSPKLLDLIDKANTTWKSGKTLFEEFQDSTPFTQQSNEPVYRYGIPGYQVNWTKRLDD